MRTWTACVVLSLIFCILCVQAQDADRVESLLRKAANELDKVDEAVEEYGSISVSAPLITRPTLDFRFDLNRTGQQYYDEPRLNGKSSLSTSSITNIQFAGDGAFGTVVRSGKGDIVTQSGANTSPPLVNQPPNASQLALPGLIPATGGGADPAAVTALNGSLTTAQTAQGPALAAVSTQIDNVATANKNLSTDTATLNADLAKPSPDPVLIAGDKAKVDVDQQKFDAEQAKLLLNRSALESANQSVKRAQDALNSYLSTNPLGRDLDAVSLSPRERIIASSGDKMSQDILRWISHPHDLGDNKVAFFCMLMVSSHPGNRTFRGYSADVTVHVDYARTGSKELQDFFRQFQCDIDARKFVDAERLINDFKSNDRLAQQTVQGEIAAAFREAKSKQNPDADAIQADLEAKREVLRSEIASAEAEILRLTCLSTKEAQHVQAAQNLQFRIQDPQADLSQIVSDSRTLGVNAEIKDNPLHHTKFLKIDGVDIPLLTNLPIRELGEKVKRAGDIIAAEQLRTKDGIVVEKTTLEESKSRLAKLNDQLALKSNELNETVWLGLSQKASSIIEHISKRYVVYAREETGVQPLVAAAYPMLDSQVLNLRTSIREQLGVALSLSAAAANLQGKAQAKLLTQFAKQLQLDVETQTSVTLGSATSHGGATFGFRVAPHLTAQNTPGSKKAKPELIMDAATFPAMVVIVCDKSQLNRKIWQQDGNAKDDTGVGKYDNLAFHIETRWHRLADPAKENGIFGRFGDMLPKDRLTEQMYYRRAAALDVAWQCIREAQHLIDIEQPGADLYRLRYADPLDRTSYDDQCKLHSLFYGRLTSMIRRAEALVALGSGQSVFQEIPQHDRLQKGDFSFESVAPDTAYPGQRNLFFVNGLGFKIDDKTLTAYMETYDNIEPNATRPIVTVLSDRVLAVNAPIYKLKDPARTGQLQLVIRTMDGENEQRYPITLLTQISNPVDPDGIVRRDANNQLLEFKPNYPFTIPEPATAQRSADTILKNLVIPVDGSNGRFLGSTNPQTQIVFRFIPVGDPSAPAKIQVGDTAKLQVRSDTALNVIAIPSGAVDSITSLDLGSSPITAANGVFSIPTTGIYSIKMARVAIAGKEKEFGDAVKAQAKADADKKSNSDLLTAATADLAAAKKATADADSTLQAAKKLVPVDPALAQKQQAYDDKKKAQEDLDTKVKDLTTKVAALGDESTKQSDLIKENQTDFVGILVLKATTSTFAPAEVAQLYIDKKVVAASAPTPVSPLPQGAKQSLQADVENQLAKFDPAKAVKIASDLKGTLDKIDFTVTATNSENQIRIVLKNELRKLLDPLSKDTGFKEAWNTVEAKIDALELVEACSKEAADNSRTTLFSLLLSALQKQIQDDKIKGLFATETWNVLSKIDFIVSNSNPANVISTKLITTLSAAYKKIPAIAQLEKSKADSFNADVAAAVSSLKLSAVASGDTLKSQADEKLRSVVFVRGGTNQGELLAAVYSAIDATDFQVTKFNKLADIKERLGINVRSKTERLISGEQKVQFQNDVEGVITSLFSACAVSPTADSSQGTNSGPLDSGSLKQNKKDTPKSPPEKSSAPPVESPKGTTKDPKPPNVMNRLPLRRDLGPVLAKLPEPGIVEVLELDMNLRPEDGKLPIAEVQEIRK